MEIFIAAAVSIIKFLIVCVIVFYVGQELYLKRNEFSFIWKIWKRIRLKMFLETVAILCALLFLADLSLQIPIVNWGWYNLFSELPGNIFILPFMEGVDSSFAAVRLSVLAFFTIFLIAIPFLAHREERVFRRGYHEWIPMFKQSLKFGLIHLYVGIPIGVALLLFIPGFYYACKYRSGYLRSLASGADERQAREEGLLDSTAAHTLFNSILIAWLLFFICSVL